VTVCSLRRDHVSAYGEHPGLTPTLDSLAARGARFDNAYAASNFTLAGLTAILTARFGSNTGVTGWDRGLTAEVDTLPEVLGYYGYRTAAFTTDAPSGFRPDYGLDRGFQRMEIYPSPRSTPDGRMRGGEPGPEGETAWPVRDWLAEQTDETPVFVAFHTRTAHFPFVLEPPDGEDATGMARALWEAGMTEVTRRQPGQNMPGMAGGTSQQGVVEIQGKDPMQALVDELGEPAVTVWRQAYAEAVRRMDADIGVLLEALEARGRMDRTILVVVADHGESLNDHGELLHGDAYFDSVINVPLVMVVPGVSTPDQQIDALVSQVDLMPTLLELVGAVVPADVDGRSLTPLLTGEATEIRGTALAEGGVARQLSEYIPGAVIAPPWILLRQHRGCGGSPTADPPRRPGEPATCLFHAEDDPQQERSLARKHPEVVAELMARWTGYREQRSRDARHLELDPDFVEELQRTGYDFRQDTP
jgi:arylsulfatase A-like enzyme